MRPRVAVAAEQHARAGPQRCRRRARRESRISCSVSNSSSLPRSPSSRNSDWAVRRHMAAEGVETVRRIAVERLLEEHLGLFRQIGERKILARALDLHVVRCELDAQRGSRLLTKNLRNTGSPQASQRNTMPICFGLRWLRSSNFGTATAVRCGQGLAMRARQGDALIFDVQFILRRDVDAHVVSPSVVCSEFGAAGRRHRPCGACDPRRIPDSCLRTIRLANRLRRRGYGWRCGRGTSDRAR